MSKIYKNENLNAEQTIANRCAHSCKKLLAEIEQVKNKIGDEFRDAMESHQNLFRLALSEAEAMAWQTAYPQLVFPSLAAEKIQAVAAWRTRQHFLHQQNSVFAETK